MYIVSYQVLLYENKAHMVLQKYFGCEGDWQAEDKNKLSSENKMHDFYFNSLRLLKKRKWGSWHHHSVCPYVSVPIITF